jgi:hypothetical protein
VGKRFVKTFFQQIIHRNWVVSTLLRFTPVTRLLQCLGQFLPVQTIDHIPFFQPAFARNARAQAQETRVFIAVGVGIDHAFHALALRIRPVTPVQIKPVRIAIQFNPSPVRRARDLD